MHICPASTSYGVTYIGNGNHVCRVDGHQVASHRASHSDVDSGVWVWIYILWLHGMCSLEDPWSVGPAGKMQRSNIEKGGNSQLANNQTLFRCAAWSDCIALLTPRWCITPIVRGAVAVCWHLRAVTEGLPMHYCTSENRARCLLSIIIRDMLMWSACSRKIF